MNDIAIAIKDIIVKNSLKAICADEINENTSLIDLGFDSIRIVEMIFELESMFEIVMEDEDIDMEAFARFGPLEELIARKVEARSMEQ